MKTQRQPLALTDSGQDLVLKMSEGNPGAISVLMRLLGGDPQSVMRILDLDDMNMRGSQIWVAFKDYAGQDLGAFTDALVRRAQEMVDKVNEICGAEHKAVRFGGSAR
jgi:hypothetical protein